MRKLHDRLNRLEEALDLESLKANLTDEEIHRIAAESGLTDDEVREIIPETQATLTNLHRKYRGDWMAIDREYDEIVARKYGLSTEDMQGIRADVKEKRG